MCIRDSFKDERDVDALLEVLAKEQPQLHLLSAAGEQALEKKAAEKAARKLPELSEDAQHSLTVLRRAKEYLDAKPELSAELSAAQRRKRAQLQSKPVYRYVALAIFVLGVAAAAYGLYSVFSHTGSYGVYFALFGFAAIFLFSSYNMLPTAHNNNNAIMKRAEKAEAAMAEYVKHYPHGAFPVKSWYAHPIVLKQMMDAVEEGRAVTVPEALDAVKARLKSLNADVEVEQEEYDEVVVIKALFLNHDYQDVYKRQPQSWPSAARIRFCSSYIKRKRCAKPHGKPPVLPWSSPAVICACAKNRSPPVRRTVPFHIGGRGHVSPVVS